MANLLDEELIPFVLGIRSLPGRPHVSTGYRFVSRGCHGVRLESIVVGGRRFTTRQALRRFVAAVTAAADRNAAPLTNQVTNPVRDDRIESDLDDAGI